jgi:hypothetical protein
MPKLVLIPPKIYITISISNKIILGSSLGSAYSLNKRLFILYSSTVSIDVFDSSILYFMSYI